MNTRRKAHNALFALTVLLALLLTVLFNGVMLLLSNRHNLAFDLTRAAAYRLDAETLKAFVGAVLDRLIFDGEQLSDLFAPLNLRWKDRTRAELVLMEELVPFLKKQTQGRNISGLAAYE